MIQGTQVSAPFKYTVMLVGIFLILFFLSSSIETYYKNKTTDGCLKININLFIILNYFRRHVYGLNACLRYRNNKLRKYKLKMSFFVKVLQYLD